MTGKSKKKIRNISSFYNKFFIFCETLPSDPHNFIVIVSNVTSDGGKNCRNIRLEIASVNCFIFYTYVIMYQQELTPKSYENVMHTFSVLLE
jgi:hypothetical protein